MIKFINALTGSPMWVHESRVEEYLALGHKIEDEATAAILTKAAKPKTKAKKPKE